MVRLASAKASASPSASGSRWNVFRAFCGFGAEAPGRFAILASMRQGDESRERQGVSSPRLQGIMEIIVRSGEASCHQSDKAVSHGSYKAFCRQSHPDRPEVDRTDTRSSALPTPFEGVQRVAPFRPMRVCTPNLQPSDYVSVGTRSISRSFATAYDDRKNRFALQLAQFPYPQNFGSYSSYFRHERDCSTSLRESTFPIFGVAITHYQAGTCVTIFSA